MENLEQLRFKKNASTLNTVIKKGLFIALNRWDFDLFNM